MTENEISEIIVDACYKIHTAPGPGLPESVYEEVLAYELLCAGLEIKRQHGIAVVYETKKLGLGFRADLIVENKVIIEIKSVATVHQKQLLTYLKPADKKLGLLVNFNEAFIKHGIQRIVNKL